MSCCQFLHKSSNIEISEGNLIITFADNPTGVIDKQRFCFRLLQNIPSGAETLPVQVIVNGVAMPLWNKYGDLVYGADLLTCMDCSGTIISNKRYVYKGYYGTATANHVILNNFPNSNCKINCF